MHGYCLSAYCCNLPLRVNSKGALFITHQHSCRRAGRGSPNAVEGDISSVMQGKGVRAPLLAPKTLIAGSAAQVSSVYLITTHTSPGQDI